MSTSAHKAPVFFISHGAPTFAIEPGVLGPSLGALGKRLSGVKAVLVVSPHWQTRDVKVMTTPVPETVHDFGGFPSALYDLNYPAAGQPQLATEVGRVLAQLREKGVMIVASGSMTHNLYEFRQSGAASEAYAVEFTHWVRQAVTGNATQAVVDYRQLAPHAQRAHPTEEHFLPLLVAMGAHGSDEDTHVVDSGGVAHGVLSMESYAWGLPA